MAKKKFKIPMKGDNEKKEDTAPGFNCEACGKPAPFWWVMLGTGALIHMGGEHGRECFDIMQKKAMS